MKTPANNLSKTRSSAKKPAATKAQALFKEGLKLHQNGQLARAKKIYQNVLKLKSDHFDALHLLGVIATQSRNHLQAVELINRAIEINPNIAETYSNRGGALKELGRLDDALASYERALQLKPDFVRGKYNLALSRLLMGDFVRGWEGYEWRWKEAQLEKSRTNFTEPLWLGREILAGKTILLHSEQGLGDTLQFCRYAKMVRELGARVILEVPKPLLGLLKNLDGVAQLVAKGSALPTFDYHCPLMSLPLAFKTDLETIPAPDNYIASDPSKVLAWQNRLGAKTKPRVGLAWRGSPKQSSDRHRSVGLAALLPLLCPQIEWFSLHKEVRESDARLLSSRADIRHFGDEMDFVETAAVVELMDLVISVDTSIAHLAGSMGKPLWVLLPYIPNWRWLLDREDSPWYPSARLFRQDRRGDWDTVTQNVKQELRTWFSTMSSND